MAQAPTQQKSPQEINAIMRRLLVDSAPKYIKKLGTVTAVAGGDARIKLANVGIITRLICQVTCNLTIGTATATIGPKGAHAAITKVKLTDFDGSDRISCSGYQLFIRNSLRNHQSALQGMAALQSAVIGTSATTAGLPTTGLTNPNIPTAVATANMVFFIEVPVAIDSDANDLRGAILAQTTVGELYLVLSFASAFYGNGDDDKVYNGAATTTVAINSISIDTFQEYYLPQALSNGVVPIPQLDILTVYELNGALRSTDNLVSGSEKLLSLPNVRQIIGVYSNYLNNAIMGGGSGNDLAIIKLIANGNNIIREYSANFLYYEQRRRLGTDIGKGAYFIDMKENPIQTNLYGNVQLSLTPGGVLTSPSVEVMYEGLYIKGAALSGLSQSG